MDTQSQNVREESLNDYSKLLIGKSWKDDAKGLKKTCLALQFVSMDKPTELAKCYVDILNIQNSANHKSNYLKEENDILIKIGHAVTAIDCYIEELVKQMYTNETSECEIMTKSAGALTFHMRLKSIEYEFPGKIYFCDLSPAQMFELAKQYKECGVKMFKDFPLFAHNYFSLAAKCLLSFNHYQPDELDENLRESEVKKKDFDELLRNVYSNIAACLIKQGRYEQIISILSFVKSEEDPNEKAAFRLATAYYNTREYQEAESVIKKVINYKSNKDLMILLEKTQKLSKANKEKSSEIAKKMLFG